MARDPYKYFRIEARELTDQLGQHLLELERAGSGGEVVPRLLRLAHTLKGAARVVRLPEIADAAHGIEDLLTPFRDQTAAAAPVETVEALLKLVDGISRRVTALAAPDAPAEASATTTVAAPAAPEEPPRVVRADVTEIDDLLDGISETYAQLSGLNDIASLAGRAQRLAEQLVEQAGQDAGVEALGGIRAAAEMLRTLTGNIELGLAGTRQRIDREILEVRDSAEQLRLVPAAALFPNFERAARDSAQVLGKDVSFASQGGDVRLDTHVIRVVQDAMLQLIRNAVAHGIEARHDRLASGKPLPGKVSITVLRRGRQVVFRCEDDGQGINVAALRAAALRQGRSAAEFDRLDGDSLVIALLGARISTAPALSEVAGRGIGMDIVRDAVAKLGADFVVHTEAGKGTSFELIVPISVSSVEALLVEGSGVNATIPLHAVRHTLRLAPGDIHRTALGETIIEDGLAIPLVSLPRLLGRNPLPRHDGSVSAIIVAGAGGLAAIGVTRLLGTAGIVFRSLPDLAPSTAAVAGASLDAEGNPLLMLDADGLVAAALNPGAPAIESAVAQRPLLVIDDSLTTRMLEQSILESAGYEVDIAVSAEDGLERARLRDYALILVDVEMPGMDGFTFIEEIRRDPRLRDTPAILVTSRNAPEDKRRGRDVGAQGYVVKSEFDQAELLDHIQQLVT